MRLAAPFARRQGAAPQAAAAATPQGEPAAAAAAQDGPTLQEQGFIPAGDAAADIINDRGPPRTMAKLSGAPKSVHDLWQEYQHGIGGNIPARQFRPRERGRCKHTYSRRLRQQLTGR